MSDIIAIASDHAGLEMKQQLTTWLKAEGFTVQDFGTHSAESCDYPDYAQALCAWIVEEPSAREAASHASGSSPRSGDIPKARRGILICGSGIGISIAANRARGIRAALVRSGFEAELSRKHNDSNVLCLGSRITGIDAAKDCVMKFLHTAFEGGRHAARIAKLD